MHETVTAEIEDVGVAVVSERECWDGVRGRLDRTGRDLVIPRARTQVLAVVVHETVQTEVDDVEARGRVGGEADPSESVIGKHRHGHNRVCPRLRRGVRVEACLMQVEVVALVDDAEIPPAFVNSARGLKNGVTYRDEPGRDLVKPRVRLRVG